MASRKVLIIDDDAVIANTARRLLERDGFEVIVYDQGFDAANFAARHAPDVVLMDVNMPFLSGDNLIQLFQRHGSLATVPIVLFSSNEEGALQRLVMTTGAVGYISKSELNHRFSERVARYLPSEPGER